MLESAFPCTVVQIRVSRRQLQPQALVTQTKGGAPLCLPQLLWPTIPLATHRARHQATGTAKLALSPR